MSRRLSGLIGCVFAWLTLAPAASAIAAPEDTITIGDSVMLGAEGTLFAQGIAVVDAKKNRQASAGIDLLRKRGTRLPATVVFHLGTNGDFPSDTCRRVIDAIGPDRHLFLLTLSVPRTWETANNQRIRRCADMHPDRVDVIDWQAAVKAHPKWLSGDGVHLRPAGAKGYARLIAEAVSSPE